MVLVVLALLGSLVGICGTLVAYDPTPLVDFRDVNSGRTPLDDRRLVLMRASGLAVAAVGTGLVVVAFLV